MKTQHSQIAHIQENIAKSIIYFFVILTLLILFGIVGYVLFKGFVSIQDTAYQVTSFQETRIRPFTGTGDSPEYILITHPEVRITDLTITDLTLMYTKRRQENWGDFTGQNSKVSPFTYQQGSAEAEFLYHLLGVEEEDLGDYTSFMNSPEEMILYVEQVEGAIGFIPAAYEKELNSAKAVPIRRFSAVVNPEVVTLFNNSQLREITETQLQELLNGEITNWNSIGGPDLAVQPIQFTLSSDPSAAAGQNYSFSQSAVKVDSLNSFSQALEGISGAIGIIPYQFAEKEQLTILDTIRHEVKRNLTWHYIVETPARSGAWGGISTIIINTFVLIIFTLLFSAPIGIMAAIHLVEYTGNKKYTKILRTGTETLAGIPSIVFGLFGYIFFVDILRLGIGFISATLTITLMILPTIIRTSEEALKSVPDSYREGSLALGATKLTTIRKVILPAATPGILNGVILAMGRTLGETAVLIYTLGSNYELVSGPKSSARVLSLHIYNLFSEAISFDRAFATATVLIFLIIAVNLGTTRFIKRLNTQRRSV